MKKHHRVALLGISLIIFLIALYGSSKYMEIAGQWFMYSIAVCLAYIAIRGE